MSTESMTGRTRSLTGHTLTASAQSAWLKTYTADSRRIEAQRRAAGDPNRRLPLPRR